jgi:hypothetical protein
MAVRSSRSIARLFTIGAAARTAILLTLLVADPGKLIAAPDPALISLQDLDRRLATIAFRLATWNTELCAQQQNWSGLVVHDLNQYAPAFRPAIADAYGLKAGYPGILAIVPDSPAADAGISEGELVSAINGHLMAPYPVTKNAAYTSIDAFLSRLETALKDAPVQLTIGSREVTREVVVRGVPGCMSRVELLPGSRLTAAADGNVVQVSGGLVEFTRNDDELAIIVAHELAHNILRHHEALSSNDSTGSPFASLGHHVALERKTERDADYLGLYLAARAGYDIAAALTFWPRFGRRGIWGILHSPTHPGWSARRDMAIMTMREITALKQAGLPLLPNLKQLGN